MSPSIAILGSGMAGLGAAFRLSEAGVEATVYEKRARPGGHTRSFASNDGFVFDDGPHISFTKNTRLQELLAQSVDGEFEILHARVNNLWRGHWIKHPAQCNLFGLPPDLVSQIVEDFVRAMGADEREPTNYEQWLRAAYGGTFAETFPMEYGLKYHTVEASGMSTDWLGPRLYRPALEEVLRGALADDTADVHYVDHFRYPSQGGFEAYLRTFLGRARIECGREVLEIDPKTATLYFADGTEESVDAVVSSLPLPILVERLRNVPAEVAEAAGRLACTTCVTVNLGIARDDLTEHHWTYLYDREQTATRLSFPHLFSPQNVPAGCSSIQAEVYYSDKYRPLEVEPEALIDPVIADLRGCGLLRESDEIVHADARLIPYANVIFDLERAESVALIRSYLDEIGLATCGRYGEWGYLWTDESFESGEAAAQNVLDGQRLSG